MDKFKAAVWSQFGAAVDTIENVIRHCPEDLWRDNSRKHMFWYIAYHTIFFLDFYMSGTDQGFKPPEPFTLSELDPAGVLPERTYTQDELLNYLDYGRQKSRKFISEMTEESVHERCKYARPELSNLELVFYTMRHVQHHAAQLIAILRQEIDSAPGWVFRAKTDLE